jgi:hypothetical protein
MVRLGRSALLLGVGALFYVACPGFAGDLCDQGRCDPADGGGDGPSTACDPQENAGCVSEANGFFVDVVKGSDTNDGSRGAPLATIGAAVAKATLDKPRVFVCEGTYKENVVVKKPLGLYGGLDCASWTLIAGKVTKVLAQPPAQGDVSYALDVDTPGASVTVQDLEMVARDAAPRDSIAVRVVKADDVVFRRVKMTAGAAGSGVKGSDGTVGMMGPQGNSATGATPGAAKICSCGGTLMTTGGVGGTPATGGGPGSPNLPPTGSFDGAGGVGASCGAGGTGHNGATAQTASIGMPASSPGGVKDGVWIGSTGGKGADAGPGQGGGGGAGQAGAGGGGGCGGCGGTGGQGGSAGGASLALLAVDASVTLASCTLLSGPAGAGGAGAAGGQGGSAGGGGLGGAGTTNGCSGGDGGKGGQGGAGAGGSGGLSACVAYVPTRPALTETTCTHGFAGTKGTGGNPGANDGAPGISADVYEATRL